MSPEDELNELRCESKWSEVAGLASHYPSDTTFVLADIESQVNIAESSAQMLKPLLHEIPRVLTTKEDAFIAAALTGHILVLLEYPKKALTALDDTFNPPSTSPYIGAVVIKSRALLGSVYKSVGDPTKAIEAMKSVNISERTLSSNREAAIWAARLYSQLYQLEPRNEHKEAYENSIKLGKIQGNARVPSLSQVEPKPQEETRGADSTVIINDIGSNGHPRNPISISEEKPQTPLQATFAKQRLIEAEADRTVDTWRQSVEFQRPLRLVVADNQRALTKKLFTQVSAWIEKTFDSAVLMRLNFEILVALGQYPEALAAFDTYIEYQKLQLLKKASGAHATPDDEVRCMDMYEVVLGVIAFAPLVQSVPRMDRMVKALESLDATKPISDETAKGIYHGVCANIYVWQALESVGNDYLYNRIELAEQNFELCFKSPWKGDALTHYLCALISIQKKPTSESFHQVRCSLEKFPDYLPLWQLLVLLLTAEHQYEDAEKVVEELLAENAYVDYSKVSTQAKRSIMELKKTQVAITEAQHGITVALEGLGEVLELVAAIYPEREIPKAHLNGGEANGTNGTYSAHSIQGTHGADKEQLTTHRGKHHSHHHHRLNILRGVTTPRKFKLSSNIRGNGTQAKASTPLDDEAKNHLVNIWLWVSQVYLRAGMYDEAHAAINEAETIGVGPTSNTIAAKAQTLVATHPALAWKKFDEALALDYDNMSAVLGKANLLDVYGRTVNGVVDDSSDSILFQSAKDELEATRSSLSSLETLVNRNPGRFTPEAWCLYGIILDNLGDQAAAKKAMWRSISLEEKSGVRAYIPNFTYTN